MNAELRRFELRVLMHLHFNIDQDIVPGQRTFAQVVVKRDHFEGLPAESFDGLQGSLHPLPVGTRREADIVNPESFHGLRGYTKNLNRCNPKRGSEELMSSLS
jgi:hypothetical protein